MSLSLTRTPWAHTRIQDPAASTGGIVVEASLRPRTGGFAEVDPGVDERADSLATLLSRPSR